MTPRERAPGTKADLLAWEKKREAERQAADQIRQALERQAAETAVGRLKTAAQEAAKRVVAAEREVADLRRQIGLVERAMRRMGLVPTGTVLEERWIEARENAADLKGAYRRARTASRLAQARLEGMGAKGAPVPDDDDLIRLDDDSLFEGAATLDLEDLGLD